MKPSFRIRLYAARERRWTFVTLLVASVMCAAAIALIVGCVFAMPWLAIGSVVLAVPLWKLAMTCAAIAGEWSERRAEEEQWHRRESCAAIIDVGETGR